MSAKKNVEYQILNQILKTGLTESLYERLEQKKPTHDLETYNHLKNTVQEINNSNEVAVWFSLYTVIANLVIIYFNKGNIENLNAIPLVVSGGIVTINSLLALTSINFLRSNYELSVGICDNSKQKLREELLYAKTIKSSDLDIQNGRENL
jgi:hypothetical protein